MTPSPVPEERGVPAHDATPHVYFPLFDWLRIVLAALVMLGHDRVVDDRLPGYAVQVFFALSGWLIGGMLLRSSRADLPRFYFNRVLRIWAPYYVALSLAVGASVLRDPIDRNWFEFIGYKSLFVHNVFGVKQLSRIAEMPLDGSIQHFWSVNGEEQFYLFAPLLLVLLAHRFGRHPLVWAALTVVAFPTEYASIFGGVLLAILAHRGLVDATNQAHRRLAAAVAIGSGVGVLTSTLLWLTIPLMCVGLVLATASTGRRRPVAAFLGGISYPLYLNHWIGVFVGNEIFQKANWSDDSVMRKLLSVVLNVLVAGLLFWLVDRRVLAHRNEWFTMPRGRLAIYCAYGMVILGLVFGLVMRVIEGGS
jgi:peptidoglycan/LPS O-acetylase OafA/YrhL